MNRMEVLHLSNDLHARLGRNPTVRIIIRKRTRFHFNPFLICEICSLMF